MASAAAIHHAGRTGSATSSALAPATKMIFSPSTGVARDTSPARAANVNTCPAKNSDAHKAACPSIHQPGSAPPRNHSGAKHTPIATFEINAVRHSPTPYTEDRFTNNTAAT